MFRKINWSFVLLMVIGCTFAISVSAQQSVTIRGKIANPSSKIASADVVKNELNGEMQSHGGYVNPDGTFVVQFPLTTATPVLFLHGGHELLLYLAPGEDLTINTDAKRFISGASYSGSAAARNEAIRQVDAYDLQHPMPSIKATHTTYTSKMNQIRSAKKSIINDYMMRSGESSNMGEFMKGIIDSQWADKLFDYPFAHSMETDNDLVNRTPVGYYDFVSTIDVPKSDAPLLPGYQFFIDKYISYRFKQTINRSTYNQQNYYKDKIDYARQQLTGRALYMAWGQSILDACKYGKVDGMNQHYTDFMNSCPVADFKTTISQAYGKAANVVAGVPAFDFNLYDANNQSVRLSSLRGKVVYLDFWATWCGPCLQEMSFSEDLRRKYAGQPIEFVYVSVDENIEVWQNFVKSKNMQGVQVNTGGGGLHTDVGQKYNVKGIPRYILIDKNGIIADSNAKRPSEGGIVKDIERLLAQ